MKEMVGVKLKKELRGLSPRAKYADRATWGLSAKLVPTFVDKGCQVVSVTNHHGRNLGFLYRSVKLNVFKNLLKRSFIKYNIKLRKKFECVGYKGLKQEVSGKPCREVIWETKP
jgi:hypothetical protein